MAEITTKKRAGRPSTKKVDETVSTNEVKSTVTDKKITSTKINIPLDTMISCRSAVRGSLVYASKRMNGYTIVWDDFGDEQFIEIQELTSMRNTDIRFFKDNWIVVEDSEGYTAEEIMKFIRVDQYYKTAIDVDNFDTLFNEDPEKIVEKISDMPNGLKGTISMRAKQLYDSGILNRIDRIKALEKALNVEIL